MAHYADMNNYCLKEYVIWKAKTPLRFALVARVTTHMSARQTLTLQ